MLTMRLRTILSFTTASLFLLAVPASAQVGVGIKGGVAISNLATEPDSSEFLDRLTDFTAGVFVATSTGAPVAGQFEALVTRRGAELNGELFGAGFLGDFATFRVTYLDLSALLRVNAGAGDTHAYLLAGPTLGINLRSEFELFGFGTDIDAATEDWDLAATIGAGVDIDGLIVEGRYSHGLRNVIVGTEFVPFEAKTRTFAVLAGFRF